MCLYVILWVLRLIFNSNILHRLLILFIYHNMPCSDIMQSEDKVKDLNRYINAVMAFLENIAEKISNIGFLNINPGRKTIAVVFAAVVVAIATVSGVFVIGEVLSDEPVTEEGITESTEPEVSFVEAAQNLTGNFLLALTSRLHYVNRLQP